MGAPNEYLLRLIITQGLRRCLPPKITGSKNGENIFLLEADKSGAFLLMQIIFGVCVEITVYNKGFMTRRQRSRSPSWPHWQCRTVKPFYGGDKKLPVSQLEVSGKKNQLNFNASSHYHWTNPYHCSQHNRIKTTVSSLSSKTFLSWHNNRLIYVNNYCD